MAEDVEGGDRLVVGVQRVVQAPQGDVRKDIPFRVEWVMAADAGVPERAQVSIGGNRPTRRGPGEEQAATHGRWRPRRRDAGTRQLILDEAAEELAQGPPVLERRA